MNTSKLETRDAADVARRRPRLALVLLLGLLALGTTGCLKVSSTAATLRDTVADAAALEYDQRIEIRVGLITTSLARLAVNVVDVDPDARLALRALRGAEVGVYRIRGQAGERSSVLDRVDEAMTHKGWQRIVGVMNPNELVAVFVPENVRTARNVEVCVLVLNEREMVVVGARGDLEPLMEMAMSHAHGLDL
ncbi:MAG: hypothetical protein ACYC23_21690 [Limisphaerales bacterium]